MKHLFVVLFLTFTVGLFARNEIKSTDEVYRQKDILTVQATEDSKIEAPSGSSAPTKLGVYNDHIEQLLTGVFDGILGHLDRIPDAIARLRGIDPDLCPLGHHL